MTTSVSCDRGSGPPSAAASSRLERCIAATGLRRGGTATDEALAAARSCVEKYVRLPTIDRWAARLESTPEQVLRAGDRTFADALVDCGSRSGIEIAVQATVAGTMRIEARNARTGERLGSTHLALQACTKMAEQAEQAQLRPFLRAQ